MELKKEIKELEIAFKQFKKHAKKSDFVESRRLADIIISKIDEISKSRELENSKDKKKVLQKLSDARQVIRLYIDNINSLEEVIRRNSKDNGKK